MIDLQQTVRGWRLASHPPVGDPVWVAAATISRRIKDAKFPVLKDFEINDFSVLPQLSKPKVLELARCEWIDHKYNCCLVGSHGTGKTHISIALGQAACRRGLRVRFFTAAALVTVLEEAQKLNTLDRFLGDSTGSISWSATNWATCPSAAAGSSCCSGSSPTATSVAACW